MCGIAGFINKKELPASAQEIISGMTDSLVHRGPDSSGTHIIPEISAAAGHRRLAVIDLNETGHQPMVSECGRYTLIYNGEIYNYKELRSELEREGLLFRGSSDTEVLMKCLISWDLEITLKKLNGMFAFAFFDRDEQNLYMARDRMGIKPLYYGFSGKNFLFSSEIKALRKHPDFNNSVNKEGMALFLRHNSIPAPWSIYENIYQLKAGYYLRFSIKHFEITGLKRYWDLARIANKGLSSPFKSVEEANARLEELLMSSVKIRMQADVPYGAFLSGGIDSSLVAALMQKQSTDKVKTFSIGFDNEQYNEAPYAAEVAGHLGTNHTEFKVTSQDALDLIPQMPELYDQPFADSSQLPTYLVSKMAREHVTVCLSGDGGDELFSGYDRYNWGCRALRWQKFPAVTRQLMGSSIKAFSPKAWDAFAKLLFFISVCRKPRFGEKLHKMAAVLPARSRFLLYEKMSSIINYPEDYIKETFDPVTVLTDKENWLQKDNYRKQMQFIDQMLYLPDDILHKVDRASMGVSLEVRVPLLDHRIVDCSWRFPNEFNTHKCKGKLPLRNILKKYVPEEMFERPKMGFGVPLHEWLRGPLKEWGSDLLSPGRLRKQDIFYGEDINRIWNIHQSGKKNLQEVLWGMLMLQAWLDKNT